MPTYEYKCSVCAVTIERQSSIGSEDSVPVCCGVLTIRQWGNTAVHFKGTGFYSTGG